ncbi:hypothetical protein [Nocardia asteroides]|uniref:hypothetical protein n=1 Tax=Nocardia asteroides TaxID=1824 RepID=UPI00364CB022
MSDQGLLQDRVTVVAYRCSSPVGVLTEVSAALDDALVGNAEAVGARDAEPYVGRPDDPGRAVVVQDQRSEVC